MKCERVAFPRRGICAGDLDRLITIKSRSLDAQESGVDFQNNFQDVKTVWANLKTSKGREMFYTTNQSDAVTHVFGVRWYDGLTSDYWIEYRGENYDILEVDNLDERNEWYLVYCNVRGDSDEAVNYA